MSHALIHGMPRYCWFVILVVWVLAERELTGQQRQNNEPPVRVVEPASWENRDPESLPAGSTARLGSHRLKHATRSGHSLAVTSDSKLLITAAEQRLRFWELPTGKFLYEAKHGSRHYSQLTLSPNDRWLVGRVERAFVMDVSSRKMLRDFGEAATMPRCFSSDSQYLIASEGQELVWYRTGTWNAEKRWRLPESLTHIGSVQFVADGRQLLVTGYYPKRMLAYFDVVSGGLLREKELTLPVQTRTTRLTDDGKYLLATPYSQEAVQIYDVETGTKVRELAGPIAASLYGLTLSPDGKTILTNWYLDHATQDASQGFQVSLWDFESGKLLRRFPVFSSGNYHILPDNRTLLNSGNTRFVFYDLGTGKSLEQGTEKQHDSMVTWLRFSPDGKSLYSLGGTVMGWDLSTQKATWSRSPAHYAAMSANGKNLVYTMYDGKMQLVDAASGTVVHTIARMVDDGETDRQYWPHFYGPHFAADSASYWVKATKHGYQLNGQAPKAGWSQWQQRDTLSGKLLWQSEQRSQSDYSHVLNNGTTLLSIELGSLHPEPGAIRVEAGMKTMNTTHPRNYGVLYDLKTLQRHSVMELPDISTHQIADSLRGNTVLTSSFKLAGKNERGWNYEEHTLYLWETTTGRRRLTIPQKYRSVLHWFLGKRVFSADGERIACFRIDGTLFLLDARSGELLWEHVTQLEQVHSAAFSPDGQTLATGHEDGVIYLWKVGDYQPKRPKLQPSEAELASWWKQLGEDDAVIAYQAIWKLVDSGSVATEMLQARMKPIPKLDQTLVKQWVTQLDSKIFADRDEATRELLRLGPDALDLLTQLLKESKSAEVQKRLDPIVHRTKVIREEVLQSSRALEVLEHQHSTQALQLVKRFALGAANHPVTLQAQVILLRWDTP